MPGATSMGGGTSGGGATQYTGPEPQGEGVERWRDSVRQTIQQYGPQYGITTQQGATNWENAMMKQIKTESSGNPNADGSKNGDSNAVAGHPSMGLLQFIPSTFNAHNISGGQFMDPHAQMAAFMDYTSKTYGYGGQDTTGHGGQGDPNAGPNFVGHGHGY